MPKIPYGAATLQLAFALLAAAFLAGGSSAPASAQISPGKLALPHADLEGSDNCTRCHSRDKSEMDGNCLSCHVAIRQLRTEGRGLHSRESDKPCAACHPDHAGRDFQLVFWGDAGMKRFDHARTGWPLEGKHAVAECRACHAPRFQTAPVVKVLHRKHPETSWLGLQTDCVACHQDPHRGSFGAACRDCHGLGSWKEIAKSEGFPHERTRFPLLGKHRAVKCASCHDPVTAWGPKPPFARCASCHTDAHAGKAALAGKAVDCDACHSVQGFAPSTFTAARHRETPYPLEGKHAGVACRSCHTRPADEAARAALGTAGVQLHPVHAACRSCHEKAHGSQLDSRPDQGACASCHTVDGWKPSTFQAADHARLSLVLEERHAEIACRSCHGPRRSGLPPLPGPAVTGPAGVMLALGDTPCQACHVDPHAGGMTKAGAAPSGSCRTCHTAGGFHRTTVDVAAHAAFAFPLEGAHRAVPCILCHTELNHPPATRTLVGDPQGVPDLPFSQRRTRCRDCHETPHGNQFTRKDGERPCSSCHDLDAFRPASRFDHDRDAAFALAGAHAKVACDRCHPGGTDSEGRRQTLYRPLPGTCQSCHGAAKP
jgi:hypothetical protein